MNYRLMKVLRSRLKKNILIHSEGEENNDPYVGSEEEEGPQIHRPSFEESNDESDNKSKEE